MGGMEMHFDGWERKGERVVLGGTRDRKETQECFFRVTPSISCKGSELGFKS